MAHEFRPTNPTVGVVQHPALFAWRAADLDLTAVTGHAPTFARASASGATADRAGKVVRWPYHQPGWDMVLNSVTGLYEPTLRLEGTRTNLCLQSENFGTTWVAIGTPTRTAAAKTIGDLVFDLLGDDSATVVAGYQESVTFTGDAVKAVSLHLAAGTSTSTVVRLRDTTAGADRLLATITWAAGVPTVVMTTGVVAGSPVALASGVYRFGFQTTSVTAANAHQMEAYPATTAALAVANTGTVYAGGVQVENAPMPSSYIKTTTGTVARTGEALSYPALWPMQANETWYLRMARPSWADLAGTLGSAWIASRGASGPRIAIEYSTASRVIQGQVYDGTTVLFTTAISVPAGTGGFVEVLFQAADLQTVPRCRLFVGDSPDSWSVTGVPIGSITPTVVVGDAAWFLGNQLHGGLTDLVIVSGLQSLATCRGLAQR